ncbi:MAG: thrombospondin [Alcanivorax borkumensis]|jgi:hypothetical protein|uniref:Thrombospondin n=2 Tax=Alcanivoracaceae TaxID=224372 RepID=Q0VPC4_ALCBS|nr:thrombospondin [Alcanivorax sp. 97CO-5]OJH06659.1 MAG: thrombospondin [Alcanivorax borkumensis]PKG02079.1 thrombospondin [Alcanivorax sp. 97CO-6]CAL16974.1 conserved hypothetical protein [Alcanivorax borkumensis SK2]
MNSLMKVLLSIMIAATLGMGLAGCEADGDSDSSGGGGNAVGNIADQDADGVPDSVDNCPANSNAMQEDLDGDGIGDVCDDDRDGDGVDNDADNCPLLANDSQEDADGDGVGDACDMDNDQDKDGTDDGVDNCPATFNPEQGDVDGDGKGDVCDDDSDGDGVDDANDNCAFTANNDQADTDTDGVGDVCEDDRDGDTVLDDVDNCLSLPNTDQSDIDLDTVGDVCDEDRDGDGVDNDGTDSSDNCPDTANNDQLDLDGDGIGNVCDDDFDGEVDLTDTDGDGVIDSEDNCPEIANEDQADDDGDGIGNVCDDNGFTCSADSTFKQLTSADYTAEGDSLGGLFEFGVCLGCSVENADSVIDGSNASYAQVNLGLALGGLLSNTRHSGAYVAVDAKDPANDISETIVGFVVSDPAASLVSLELLGDFVSILFINDGEIVHEVKRIEAHLLGLSLLGLGANTDQRFIAALAPSDVSFDSIQLNYGGVLNLNKTLRVHDVCVGSPSF